MTNRFFFIFCGIMSAAIYGLANATTPPPSKPLPPPATKTLDPCMDALARLELPPLYRQRLAAIMITESQYYKGKPNPYALNIEGKGHHPKTAKEALGIINNAVKQGKTNIDRGCMQINFRAHPDAFESHWAALNASINVSYGASYFMDLKERKNCLIGEALRLSKLPKAQVPPALRKWHTAIQSPINKATACYHNAASPTKQWKYLQLVNRSMAVNPGTPRITTNSPAAAKTSS